MNLKTLLLGVVLSLVLLLAAMKHYLHTSGISEHGCLKNGICQHPKSLFPVYAKQNPLLASGPSACASSILTNISLTQPFITKDPQPVNYTMYVHPRKVDMFVSASTLRNGGNEMFEMHVKQRIYQLLRGTDGSFVPPKDPLFLDIGANIGIRIFVSLVCDGFDDPCLRHINVVRTGLANCAIMRFDLQASMPYSLHT
jgi:hypothetical protein